jgi:hypothetical protein
MRPLFEAGLAIVGTVVVAVLLAAGGVDLPRRHRPPAHAGPRPRRAAFCSRGLAVFHSTIGRTEQANAGIAWGLL